MSVSGIINPATGKIYDELAPQGGGVPLQKGGLITALAGGVEAPLPAGNNGWVLSANSGVDLGLEYIQLPAGGIAFQAEGQMLYAGAGPAFADSLLPIGNAGQILGINAGIPAWINAGGSGTITALAPLTEYADGTASKVAVNFTGKGDLIVGGGVQVGGEPVAGAILPVGANDMVLTANSGTATGLEWKASGGGSSATIYRNSVDNVPLPIDKPTTANDTCVITADRTYQVFTPAEIYNNTGAGVNNVDATGGLTFLSYTPTADIVVSNIVVQIFIIANLLVPTPQNNTGSVSIYQGATLILAGDIDSFGSISANLSQFNIPSPSPTTLLQGTTYTFNFEVDSMISTTIEFVNTNPLATEYKGNATITGIQYLGQPASFTINPPTSKFRITNDLVGKTSATCENFSSQSFVASGDAVDWIAVGGINGGVAFA